MNYIGAMLPICLYPTTLIVLHHINDLAFIADMSGFYGYFKVETVVLWPVMLLVPHQLIYLFGNFHKRRGIQSVAARFGPPATLQRAYESAGASGQLRSLRSLRVNLQKGMNRSKLCSPVTIDMDHNMDHFLR